MAYSLQEVNGREIARQERTEERERITAEHFSTIHYLIQSFRRLVPRIEKRRIKKRSTARKIEIKRKAKDKEKRIDG